MARLDWPGKVLDRSVMRVFRFFNHCQGKKRAEARNFGLRILCPGNGCACGARVALLQLPYPPHVHEYFSTLDHELGFSEPKIGIMKGVVERISNLNDVLMETLADNGNGSYAYVDDLDEAQKLFVEDLTSTLQVIALDAKVQVDFNPDVVAYYRLIGYENRDVADQDFRNDAVDAGEIGAGHSATALYAVTFRPNADGRIATVQLRWEDPDTHQVTEINGNFNTWDLAQSFESADPRYQLAVIVMQYAEMLRHSPWAAGTYGSQLVEHAYRISSILWDDTEVTEFASLVSRASQIRALGN